MGHHACPHRIQLNIPTYGRQVPFIINHGTLELPLPDRSGPPVLVVHIPGVPPGYPFHDLGQVPRIRGFEEEMDMVGHEHIGVKAASIKCFGPPEVCQIAGIILWFRKEGLPVVAAVQNVMWL